MTTDERIGVLQNRGWNLQQNKDDLSQYKICLWLMNPYCRGELLRKYGVIGSLEECLTFAEKVEKVGVRGDANIQQGQEYPRAPYDFAFLHGNITHPKGNIGDDRMWAEGYPKDGSTRTPPVTCKDEQRTN